MSVNDLIKIYCPKLNYNLMKTPKFFYGWIINETTFCLSHFSNKNISQQFLNQKDQPEILGSSDLNKQYKFQFFIEKNKLKIKTYDFTCDKDRDDEIFSVSNFIDRIIENNEKKRFKEKFESLQNFILKVLIILFQQIFEIFLVFVLIIQFLFKGIFLFFTITSTTSSTEEEREINTPEGFKQETYSNKKINIFSSNFFNLRNMTSFGNQLNSRLNFINKMKLKKLKFHETSFRFFIDLIIGIFITIYCLKNIDQIEGLVFNVLNFFKTYFISHIKWLIDGWPGGLKLNENLSSFLGNMILDSFEIWTNLIELFNLKYIIYLILICGLLGFSFLISMLRDVFGLIIGSFIFIFYVVFSKIYSYQLAGIISFWRFFRGWKFNQLRNRIDIYYYSSSQMILGTILFTLFVFLFPTISVYYFSFAVFRIFLNLIQNLFGIIIESFNIFPIYFFFLKLIKPSSLTNGYYLNYLFKDGNEIHFELKKKLVSYWNIIIFEKDISIFEFNIIEILRKFIKGELLPRVLFVSSSKFKNEIIFEIDHPLFNYFKNQTSIN
eukprot:gene12558-6378_t